MHLSGLAKLCFRNTRKACLFVTPFLLFNTYLQIMKAASPTSMAKPFFMTACAKTFSLPQQRFCIYTRVWCMQATVKYEPKAFNKLLQSHTKEYPRQWPQAKHKMKKKMSHLGSYILHFASG